MVGIGAREGVTGSLTETLAFEDAVPKAMIQVKYSDIVRSYCKI